MRLVLPAVCRGLLALAVAAAGPLAEAKTTTYVCTGPDGRKTIQGTPCTEPSTPTAVPPRPCSMTDSEFDRAARQEKAFFNRYPSGSTHRSAHRAEVVSVVARLRPMQERLTLLLTEKREIDKELAFFVGKPVPTSLAARHEANQAQLTGITPAFQRLEETIREVETRRQCEMETYGPLWTGAPTGISACKRPACVAQ